MRMSLNWLSNFINLDGLSEEDIINKIIKAGFEVEEVLHLGQGTGIVVGEVLECIDHPNSDHLHITKVNVGDEVLDIVCGAPNCRKGLKVIVAKVGAKLPGGEIKPGVLRGVPSNGMLCSLLELGISKDLLDESSASHIGIEELPDNFEVGETDILKKLGYEDTILDLSIYANRQDCLAMFSLAKEMGAILNREVTLPNYLGKSNVGKPSTLKVTSTTSNCPHYMAKVINKVSLKPSVDWMKKVLRSYGIKAINNLVDISNIVMLETGQPLHFFDLRSNPNRNITVVDDYCGEYVALDGNTYNITNGDLMITSDLKPIAIAGIMGGEGSKVLDDTTSIIIESAAFDYAQIRRTANRIGLMSEAASRFSKGLEPLAQEKAMDRAVDLLIKYADAEEIEETVTAGSNNYVPHTVKETLSHLNGLIGKKYQLEEVVDVLKRLDFAPEVEGEEIIAHIPSYHANDIKLREDIDEEIVRLTDFDDLKSTLPFLTTTIGKLSTRQSLRRDIRDLLMNQGLNEAVTYTLLSDKEKELTVLSLGESIALASPLSDARKNIRTSLFASMVNTLAYNVAHGNEDINLFELSSLYAKEKDKHEHLAIMLHGEFGSKSLKEKPMKADYYVMKGLIYGLLDKLGYAAERISLEGEENISFFHPYRTAKLLIAGEVFAVFGELHPSFVKEKKLGSAIYAEIDLDVLTSQKPSSIKSKEINKYPAVTRDISLLINKDTTAHDIIKCIKKAGKSLVSNVKVFDVFEGKDIANNKRSLSLTITYLAKDHTLTTEEVNKTHDEVLKDLADKYQAFLRN